MPGQAGPAELPESLATEPADADLGSPALPAPEDPLAGRLGLLLFPSARALAGAERAARFSCRRLPVPCAGNTVPSLALFLSS